MNLKFISMLTLAALLFLAACKTEVTLEQAVKEIETIDAKYNTSFKQEKLGVTMPSYDNLKKIIEDVNTLKARLEKSSGPEKDLVLLFVNARLEMLESEKNYITAKGYGKEGVYEKFLNCDNRQKLLEAASYYNASHANGIAAIKTLDDIMQNSTKARELIGTDSNRPNFYASSELGTIFKIANQNVNVVKKYCA